MRRIKTRNLKGKTMFFGREPALILGLAQAVIAVGIGFGLDISTEQMGLIMAAVAATLSVWTRAKVSPVDNKTGQIIKS